MSIKQVRILSLFCGAGPERESLLKRYKGKQIHYVGVDDDSWIRDTPRLTTFRSINASNLYETRFVESLDLKKPSELRAFLTRITNGTQFKEIHVHMPWNIKGHRNVALNVLSEFLENGGHIFHSNPHNMGQRDSLIETDFPQVPYLESTMPNLSKVHPSFEGLDETDMLQYRAKRTMYNDVARGAGLKVKFYALRRMYDRGPSHSPWIFSTRRKSSDKEDDRVHTYVIKHSRFPNEVGEFLVLQKEKK